MPVKGYEKKLIVDLAALIPFLFSYLERIWPALRGARLKNKFSIYSSRGA